MPDPIEIELELVPEDTEIRPPEFFQGFDADAQDPKTEQEALEARLRREPLRG
jgi:hypothetical protein